jgi:hypothetical protein
MADEDYDYSEDEDPSPAVPPMSLAQLFQASRQLVHRRWFKNEVVTFDGYNFLECRFDNCTLVYHTGDFRIVRCFFSGTQLLHPDVGMRAIKLYWTAMGHADPALGQFGPVKHLDGTFSLDAGIL